MADRTGLRVLEIARIFNVNTSIVLVESLRGTPSVGMHFVCSDVPGRWEVASFCAIPFRLIHTRPRPINLRIINLEPGKELRAGIVLVEAKPEEPGAGEGSGSGDAPSSHNAAPG